MTKFETTRTPDSGSRPEPEPERRENPIPESHELGDPGSRVIDFKPQIIELREHLAGPGGDGPANIVFGIDAFDPSINGHEPYSDAFHEKIRNREIEIDGRTLTMEDLNRPMSEIFSDLNESSIEDRLTQVLGDIEPKKYS